MPVTDNDAAIRSRAYDLWERAGRPAGHQHQHWAEARRQIESEMPASGFPEETGTVDRDEAVNGVGYQREIIRLRQALYTPEHFSFELFGAECPRIDRPIVMNVADMKDGPRRSAENRRAA